MSDTIPQTILNKARADKFILVLDMPKILKDMVSNTQRTNKLINLDKLQFSVIGTTIPSITVPAISINVYGQAYQATSQSRPQYTPINVEFTIDNNFDNYWILWKWLYILNHPRTSGMDEHFAKFEKTTENNINNIREISNSLIKKTVPDPKILTKKYDFIHALNNYTDYQTTFSIYGLREYNEKIIRFDYYNAFITALGQIKYDYRENGELLCSFEFVFDQLDITLLDTGENI